MRLAPFHRPLTAAERRLIRAKITDLGSRRRRASRLALPLTGGTVLLLWVWTLLASDAPWFIITAFWIAVGAAITWWVHRDLRSDGNFHQMAEQLEGALRRNTAEVYDIRAHACAELEEIEDEGACFVFELEGARLAFISGQHFYPGARFPSLDFSVVYPVDESGRPVDMFLEKRGARAMPVKTIDAAAKWRIEVPDHLEVRTGTIRDLEAVLGLPDPGRAG